MIDRIRELLAETKLASLFEEVQFPLSKQELIEIATEHNAPDKVIEILDSLPDVVYTSVGEIYEHWRQTKEGE